MNFRKFGKKLSLRDISMLEKNQASLLKSARAVRITSWLSNVSINRDSKDGRKILESALLHTNWSMLRVHHELWTEDDEGWPDILLPLAAINEERKHSNRVKHHQIKLTFVVLGFHCLLGVSEGYRKSNEDCICQFYNVYVC